MILARRHVVDRATIDILRGERINVHPRSMPLYHIIRLSRLRLDRKPVLHPLPPMTRGNPQTAPICTQTGRGNGLLDRRTASGRQGQRQREPLHDGHC